jgi:lipid II:glycine glycyltransferase (peptidoglycan interpeptide bridge formation enzyme)
MGNSAIYVLGATNADAMKLKAAYVLQWAAINWLKNIGIRYYDLGGIDPESNRGVHHFKQGLSGMDARHISAFVASEGWIKSTVVTLGLRLRRRIRESRHKHVNSVTR